jgi:hypothetical protein
VLITVDGLEVGADRQGKRGRVALRVVGALAQSPPQVVGDPTPGIGVDVAPLDRGGRAIDHGAPDRGVNAEGGAGSGHRRGLSVDGRRRERDREGDGDENRKGTHAKQGQ